MTRSPFARVVVLLVALAVMLPVLPAAAQPLTDAERQALLDHLERTRKLFMESVDGLSEAQWNYKPAEDRWSVAETAEHITATETFLRDRVQGLRESEITPEQLASSHRNADEILPMITDRSQKFQAPEPLQPTTRFDSPAETMATFEKERAATVSLAQEGGDLRSFAGPHPGFEFLDAYGWLIFLSGHTERHVQQIEEIKADPGFPKA